MLYGSHMEEKYNRVEQILVWSWKYTREQLNSMNMTIKSFEKKGFIVNKPFEVNGKRFEVSPTMHGFHYRFDITAIHIPIYIIIIWITKFSAWQDITSFTQAEKTA